jgi:hypothetical protein
MNPGTKQWNYEGSTRPEPFVRLVREDGMRGPILCPRCGRPNGSLWNGACSDCRRPSKGNAE